MKVDPRDRSIYRRGVQAAGLVRFELAIKETDLLVLADRDIGDLVREIVINERDRLERYLAAHPEFARSLVPVAVADAAPRIAGAMAAAGAAAGVGPMAAVAGAVCDAVAAGVGDRVRELIIENGGDLYVRVSRERTVGIYTGEKGPALGLLVRPEGGPLGVCTSSGRIGHSLSFGDAAAATIIAG
ncbi:MAG TPA: UPF0280 family protein, partial [bacterium]